MDLQESGATLVQLEPFDHQVSGQHRIFHLEDGIIGKPLSYREHSFYMTMPRSLLDFTPQYRGIVNIAWKANGTGGMSPVVRRSRVLDENGITCPDEELCNSSLVMFGSNEQNVIATARFAYINERALSAVNAEDSPTQKGLSPCKFMLLTNLVLNFRKPCILDLKMGFRQHGDDATEYERIVRMKTCAETTSISLGFRLCGMKVYKASTGEYVAHDKYHGQRLDCDGVSRTLRYFLHDGQRTLTDVIDQLLDRLHRLEKAIEHLDSYRFYGTSLLIVYDGNDTACGDECHSISSPRQTSVSMIDFGHATKSGFFGDTLVHVGPHRGFLFGLRNLMRILEELLGDCDPADRVFQCK